MIIVVALTILKFSYTLPDLIPMNNFNLQANGLKDYLQSHQVRRPLYTFNWSFWTRDAVMVLLLDKAKIPFAVENAWKKHQKDWPLFLGTNFRATGDEDYVIFSDHCNRPLKSENVIKQNDTACLFVTRITH